VFGEVLLWAIATQRGTHRHPDHAEIERCQALGGAGPSEASPFAPGITVLRARDAEWTHHPFRLPTTAPPTQAAVQPRRVPLAPLPPGTARHGLQFLHPNRPQVNGLGDGNPGLPVGHWRVTGRL